MTAPAPAPVLSFAALRHPGFRAFFVGNALAMTADSVEHVISYWMMFRKFQSPALGGYAVLSHWLPFLLFSVPVGALADRIDPRRLMQAGMLCFMFVSCCWGVLFLTDSLQIWHAVVLLSIHGIAGTLWGPPRSLMVHYIAPTQLTSAVRLNAMSLYLGMLLGPAVGAGVMLVLGPVYGIFVNVFLYVPLLVWLWKAPYGPAVTPHAGGGAGQRMRGLADLLPTIRAIAGNRTIVSMTLLAGTASLFIGSAYQAQMPGFAHDLGHGNVDFSYSMLLAADAAGALIAGVLLESRNLLQPRPRTAFVLAIVWCVALAAFAATRSYHLALALLLAGGFVELSFNAMAQTLVQIHAPVAIRGRVIGLFTMAAQGLRTFSGVCVGMLGGLIGIHASLELSAVVLGVLLVALLAVGPRRIRPPAEAGH